MIQLTDINDLHANIKPLLSEMIGRLEAAEKELNVLKAKVERMEKRPRIILEEPENTMSNSKAMREMLRQARLALEKSK